MVATFCIEALEGGGRPPRSIEIFYTEAASRFTSPRFTDVLSAAGVKVSMYGTGVERLCDRADDG